MSFVLCFSNLISSFKACSFNLTFNSASFCFSFAISIFSNLSCSCFSNFNLLASSFFRILYCEIVSAILSKNAWIYFSKPKFNLNLNSGLREFWKLINFKRKFDCFDSIDLYFFITFLNLPLRFVVSFSLSFWLIINIIYLILDNTNILTFLE